MRQYTRAPSTSANRIRERYLHQLGLQRGAGVVVPHIPESSHVVVISGLPSLPEERATTENVEHNAEDHEHEHVEQHHGQDYSGDNEGQGDGESDSCSSHARSSGQPPQQQQQQQPHHGFYLACAASQGGDASSLPSVAASHCSKSTNTSVSPLLTSSINGKEAGESITSLALSYPKALLLKQQPSNNSSNNAFSPWRMSTSLSKPASFLLDSADHDSVSSTATSTTAESSFSAMVSRDWGAVTYSSAQPDSSVSNNEAMGQSQQQQHQGVYFQQRARHYSFGGSNATTPATPPLCGVSTSTLTHALNRFNIDSDCDASVASNSIMGCGNSIMTEEEDDVMMDQEDDEEILSCDDTTASHASHRSSSEVISSNMSTGSSKSQLSSSIRSSGRKKKIGKAQRLMDRAVAHERILRTRSDRSIKFRANLIHSQRMSHHNVSSSCAAASSSSSSPCLAAVTPAAMASSLKMPQEIVPPSGEGNQNTSSIPLLHVQHPRNWTATNSECPIPNDPLGRTPTASNCSDFRKFSQSIQGLAVPGLQHPLVPPPSQHPPNFLNSMLYPGLNSPPMGVHISANSCQDVPLPNAQSGSSNHSSGGSTRLGKGAAIRPLQYHPQLASRIPTPPPKLGVTTTPSDSNISSRPEEVSSSPKPSAVLNNGMASSGWEREHHHSTTINSMDVVPTASIDVLEVAMTLSKLGGRCGSGTIPRVR